MAFPNNTHYDINAFDGSVSSDIMRYAAPTDATKAELIDYSITTFSEYKSALTNYVKAVYPEDYTSFSESDLGTMFIELFSYIGSVISLKADFLANESYLPTVQSPENVRKMLRLIGMSLKGPTSAKAEASISWRSGENPAVSALSIPAANRTIYTTGAGDKQAVAYTIYKTDANGFIEYDGSGLGDLSLSSAPSTYSLNSLYLLEGSLSSQTGAFGRTDNNQSIELSGSPVIEGSIVVSSSDGSVYTEIENLFLASANQKVFEKEYNSDYGATIKFGDGTRGHKPTPGGTYSVYYRTGGGERGNVKSRALTLKTTATKNSTASEVTLSIVNLTAATGGRNAETVAHAKKYAPSYFKTQYRAVTAEDYKAQIEAFISDAGATGKGITVLRRNGLGANMLDVYVLGISNSASLERASLQYKADLLTHLNTLKMMTDELTIVDGVIRTVDLVCTVTTDISNKSKEGTIRQAVAKKINEQLSYDNMDFGLPLNFSNLTSAVLGVDNVRMFTVDNFAGDISVSFNEIIQLNNYEISVNYV